MLLSVRVKIQARLHKARLKCRGARRDALRHHIHSRSEIKLSYTYILFAGSLPALGTSVSSYFQNK